MTTTKTCLLTLTLMLAAGPASAEEDLELSGRVVVREQLASEDGEAWTAGLALEDARLSAEYHHGKRVDIVVEVKAETSDTEIKDAYVDLRVRKGLHVRAGHIKLPISPLHNTSRWRLPTVDRGLLAGLLDDGLGIEGRRLGAHVEWEPDCACAPRVLLGAYQTINGGGPDDGLLVDDQGGLEVVLRGELGEPDVARFGASVSSRMALDAVSADRVRLWATGVDVTTDRPLAGGHLRGWLEAQLGSTQLDATPATTKDPRFLVGRALVGWRCGGAEDGDRYVEPFVSGGLLDVNLANDDDLVGEVALGVNAGEWDEWRVQLQGELSRAQTLVPVGIGGGLSGLPDRVAVTLQLGATF